MLRNKLIKHFKMGWHLILDFILENNLHYKVNEFFSNYSTKQKNYYLV
jgi:hypothetical protein